MTAALHKVSREIGTALRFGVVGAAATGVHVSVALSLFLKTGAGIWLANVAGFLAAAGVSLLGQHRWVFGSSRPLRATALPFLAVAAAGFAFNNLVVGTLSVGLAASGSASLTIAALLTPAATYAINRFFVF
ncbi:MAG: GtrA family protein [Burkholderiaceae bacterium]